MTRRPKPTPRSLPKEVAELVAANSAACKQRASIKSEIDWHVDSMLACGAESDAIAEVLEGVAQRVRSDARRKANVKP